MLQWRATGIAIPAEKGVPMLHHRLPSAGVVPLVTATLLVPLVAPPRAAAALYAYATQQTTTYTVTNASAGLPTVVSSTSASQSAGPAGSEAHTGGLDAPQSYVGPASARPAENFFGRKGMTTPNYARADTVFTQPPPTPRNVAELYLTAPGSATASGTNTLTLPLAVTTGGPVSITLNYSNFSVVEHPGTVAGSVQATHAFEVTVEDADGVSVYFAAPNVVNRTTLYDSFGSSQESLSGQVTFTTSVLVPGVYTARFVSTEMVAAEIVPEPGAAGAGCGLALLVLRRRRREAAGRATTNTR
jgi:hypothetical protein